MSDRFHTWRRCFSRRFRRRRCHCRRWTFFHFHFTFRVLPNTKIKRTNQTYKRTIDGGLVDWSVGK